jgi:hypothetical protein
MIMVVIVALVLAPFSWSSPGLIAVELILIIASPFLLDLLDGGPDQLNPLKTKRSRHPISCDLVPGGLRRTKEKRLSDENTTPYP